MTEQKIDPLEAEAKAAAEREALAQVVYYWDTSESVGGKTWDELTEGMRDTWREAADAILAAGFHRHPQPAEGEPNKARAVQQAIDLASTTFGDYDDAQGALDTIHALLAGVVADQGEER